MRSITSLLILLTVAAFPAKNMRAEPLSLLYDIRPPYYTRDKDGQIGGLVAGLVDRAFVEAGIEVTWERLRFNRQIESIATGQAACSPGWFKNPERETFAQFSIPLYRDQPQVIVVETEDAQKFDHPTLSALFQDKDLRFGAKLSYSYGRFIDTLLEVHHPPMKRTAHSVQGLVGLMLQDRFDYTIMSGEEFDNLAVSTGDRDRPFTAISYPDIPPGNDRYLMCANTVDGTILRRFNNAVTKILSE